MLLFKQDIEKENRVLALALAAFLAIAALVLAARLDGPQTPDEPAFRVDRPDEINRVQLISATDTTDLAFTGARWQVSGRYPADRRMVTVFFATVAQVKPLRRVGGSEADSARNWLRRTGVQVQLYRQGRLATSYRVGGNPTKTISYFLSDEGAVHAMHIPGYRVYASAVFEAPPHAWRDTRLFDFNWNNFRSLRMRTTDRSHDFDVTFNGKTFAIEALDTDTAKLNTYLDEASLMAAEAHYRPGTTPAFDSLLATVPAFEILVNDVAGGTYRLEVFRPVPGEAHLLARLNGEAVLLSREKGAALARKRTYFSRAR